MAQLISQDECLAFLANPDNLGQPGPVSRIDTHISAVFLAGDRAFKLKRAVKNAFLDFSTLDLREQACRAELSINRRTAPHLYLAVRPIVRRADGRLAFDGAGAVVDWVVEMRRFDQDGLYDRLADSLTREDAHQLAETIAAFHQQAEPQESWGGADGIRHTITTNNQTFRQDCGGLFPQSDSDALMAHSEEWLDRLAPLLDRRRRDGLVRRCHGDLHLGNICRDQGRPVLFDAIEFNQDFACIDVLYDLSFLLMDLQSRGLDRMASWLMNRYLECRDELAGLPAMPLFLSLRAAIRAHVSAAMAEAVANDPARVDELRRRARDYMARAVAYLSPAPPRLLAVGGLSGSGKSRLARDIAPVLGAPMGAVVLRTDVLRKRLMGVAPETRLGPEGYTAKMGKRTYQALHDGCARLLEAGLPVVADAVFAKPEQRAEIEELAHRLGVPFDGLWLEADPEALRQRIASRKQNASDATAEVLARQLEIPLGEMTWTRIDSSGSKEETFANACHRLGLAAQL